MSENPYAAPTDTDETSEDSAWPECPRFHVSLNVLKDSIDEETARKMLAACEPMPASYNTTPVAPASGRKSLGWLLLLAVAVVAIMFSGPQPSTSVTTERIDTIPTYVRVLSATVISFGSILLAFGIYLVVRFRFKVAEADPPPWGEQQIQFRPEWFAVNKRSKDDIRIETRCPWNETHIHQCDDGWMLLSNFTFPTLIRRQRIESSATQAALHGFFQQLADWQHATRFVGDQTKAVQSDPPASNKCLPSAPTEGIPFKIQTRDEIQLRRKLSKTIRRLFPTYSAKIPWLPSPSTWIAASWIQIVLSLAAILVHFADNSAAFAFVVGVPGLIFGGLILFIAKAFSAETQTSGVVTADKLWLDSKTHQQIVSLSDYPNRHIVEGVLLLGSKNGKSVFVLAQESFNENDWTKVWEQIV